MYRVTADTNVLVSALNYPGPPFRFLELAKTEVFNLQLSESIMKETEHIPREKFGWPHERAEQAKEVLSFISQRVMPHIE